MRRLKLVLEYDGTDFHGWQIQSDVRTVQGELQQALFKMTGEKSAVRGASRTDAGVHARGQVAHITTESRIPTYKFVPGLTTLTGYDLAVVEAEEVSLDFSARYDAKGKTYHYQLWNFQTPSPILRRTTWHVRPDLDIEAMRRGASHLMGIQDFAAFRAADCDALTTVRHIQGLDIERSENLVTFTVKGTAFLQHMVRIIVGTLVRVGEGKRTPDDVARIRDSRDRSQAGITAPAQGLCLVTVHY